MFEDEWVASFWDAGEHAKKHVDAPVTDEIVAFVEAKLGYKLPASYIALMRHQNGGIPVRTRHKSAGPTSWADDHIAITSIAAIGSQAENALCGETGSQFMIDEWGYPNIGVYFADCPSAGHDMVCLDYRACGPQGEPQVVHVDQDDDFKITFLAPSFEAFVRGLYEEETDDDD